MAVARCLRVFAAFLLGIAAVGPAASQILPWLPLERIHVVLPVGTPLRVALDRPVPLGKVGDPVTGRLVEPVFCFDREVLPAGTRILGHIAKIDPVSSGRRVRAVLAGDFTPPHGVVLAFDALELSDGSKLSLRTAVAPGTPDLVRLVSPAAQKSSKKSSAINEARRQARQEWDSTLAQVKAPDKLHRLKEYLLAQLPIRKQTLAAGTRYDAELLAPLDFGEGIFDRNDLALPGSPPPPDSEVFARLLTSLSSANSQQGELVEARITRPLFSEHHKLILPEGSRVLGRVVQVKPSSKLHRNGKLQIVFSRIQWPSGSSLPVEASLDSVTVSRGENLRLDSEGGTAVTSPKTRYLQTGLSIGVAAVTSHTDSEDAASNAGGDAGKRALGGGSGLRLVGLLAGLAIPYRQFGMVLGAYGAGMSVYHNFLSQGHDVVFRANTPMEIGFGGHEPPAKTVTPKLLISLSAR